MDLYLIRHAEAVDREDPNYVDEERPLTEAGRGQSRALAAALVARDIRFDAVIASPLLRTRQTAEEMLQNMPGPMAELQFCKQLAPGGKGRKLTRYLLGIEGDAVALIGHEPDLSEFAGRLLGDRDASLKFAKAGIALIRCDGLPDKGRGTLIWWLTPEWFAAPDLEPTVRAAGSW